MRSSKVGPFFVGYFLLLRPSWGFGTGKGLEDGIGIGIGGIGERVRRDGLRLEAFMKKVGVLRM